MCIKLGTISGISPGYPPPQAGGRSCCLATPAFTRVQATGLWRSQVLASIGETRLVHNGAAPLLLFLWFYKSFQGITRNILRGHGKGLRMLLLFLWFYKSFQGITRNILRGHGKGLRPLQAADLRAGPGPVRAPGLSCLIGPASDRQRWLGPAKPFSANRSTRAHPQHGQSVLGRTTPSKKPEWAQPGPFPGLGKAACTRIPGQTWGHLSHKCRLIHSGSRPAAFVPGVATAATLPHPHGCRQGKCLVAQRKIPVVHSCGPALLLRLCFYKDIQGRTRNNRGRAVPEPRQRIEGLFMPRWGPGGLPHAVHAQGWAWKGRRCAFRRKAVGGLPRRLVAGLWGLWRRGKWGLDGMSVPCAPAMRARLLRVSAGKASGPGSLPGRFQAAAG